MSEVSLAAESESRVQAVPFHQAARACAVKVALSATIAIGVLAIVGVGIENRDSVEQGILASWATLLWVLSFGGSFWGSVALSSVFLGAIAWVPCVWSLLPEQGEEEAKSVLGPVGLVSAALWFASYCAMQSTFLSFGALTVYQRIAVFALSVPLIVCAIAFVLLWIELAKCATAQQKN